MAAAPSVGRTSFFDDDNVDIKFDWTKLEKTPYNDVLNQHPLQRDNLTRTQLNGSTSLQCYFLLYSRCIIQFKVDAFLLFQQSKL